MIHVTATLSDGRSELVVDGHENYAEAGRVCAAVSAIVSTALLGLEAIGEQYPHLVTIDIKETPPQ